MGNHVGAKKLAVLGSEPTYTFTIPFGMSLFIKVANRGGKTKTYAKTKQVRGVDWS